jgi:hypothetical protein
MPEIVSPDFKSQIFFIVMVPLPPASGLDNCPTKLDVLDSLHKIVHAPTPQIKETNANAPNELQRIVRRCLAKESDERYQTIKGLALELK